MSSIGGKGGYAAATVSITLVLLLLGAVAYSIVHVNRESKSMLGNVGFSVMLEDGITPRQRDAIEQGLKSDPIVKQIKYLSKEEAARDFKNYINSDFVAILGSNPIPASFELILQNDQDNNDAVRELEKRAAALEGASMVLYQGDTAEAVLQVFQRINMILLGFGALLLGISVILIYNTLKLDVTTNIETIRTMKLVGAKNSFIRRPFILRSLTQGALAGALACIALYLLIDGIPVMMPEFKMASDPELMAVIFCGMVVSGIVICTLFTRLALNKYIKH